MNNNEPHLSEEMLAALIDGQVSPDEETFARAHLSRCRECMATYTQSVRHITEWRQGVVRTPDAVATTNSRSLPRLRYLVAACLPLLLLAGAWWAFTASDQSNTIRRHLAESSYSGMILPGAENEIWSPPPTTRGTNTDDRDWDRVLDGKPWRRPDPAHEIGLWIAQGKDDRARILHTNEETTHPDDPELLILKGILAYRQHDPTDPQRPLHDAAKHFRRALEVSPANPVARFNLALVMIDLEEIDQARPLLKELVAEKGHTFVSRRAELVLSELELTTTS